MKKLIAAALAVVMLFALAIPAGAVDYYDSSASRTVTVDGSISSDEWGAAVASFSHTDCWAKNATEHWDCWTFSTPPDGQKVELYLTRDTANIYVGVRLVNAANFDEGAASIGDLWNHAHLAFTISRYEAATTVPRIFFEGQTYEQYVGYYMGLLNGTTKASRCFTQGIAAADLTDEQYSIAYDDASKTYTYEVAIPLANTNIDDLTEAVCVSLEVGDSHTEKDGNRYFISQAAMQCNEHGGAGMTHHAYSRPVVISLPGVDPYVGTTASPIPESVTIDGDLAEEEWGEPVVLTTPAHTAKTWGNFWEFDPASIVKGQTAKLYVTNDRNYIYVGFKLDKCDLDTSNPGAEAMYKCAHFGFTISAWDDENTVKRIEFEGQTYEQYTGFIMGMVNGKPTANIMTQGIDYLPLGEENFAIKYDAEARTYSYEVRVPYSMTNIDMHNSLDIAISANAGCPYTMGDGANRYNLTTGAATCGGAGNFAHRDNALKVTLNDATKKINAYVNDTASPVPAGIAIDGIVSTTEWGEPMIVTNPAHCAATWGNYWSFDPTAVNNDQLAKIYLTNDGKYIYLAAVLDECDEDPGVTDPALIYKTAHFGFSFSQYDKTNTVKRIIYKNQKYEQYTGFIMGMVNGKPTANIMTQGIDYLPLGEENFAIKYDAEARTYTYEVRIPYKMTNVDIRRDNEVALSINIGAPYTTGDGANRYNLTTGAAFCGGADNWAHLNNAMHVYLNINPNTGDMNVAMLAGLCTAAVIGTGSVLLIRRKARVSSK